MKMSFAFVLAMTAGSATAAPVYGPPAAPEACCVDSCATDAHARFAARKLIEAQTFYALPVEQRETIAAKLAEMGEEVPSFEGEQINPELYAERNKPLSAEEFEAAWEKVRHTTTREAFESFKPIHQRMLASFVEIEHDVPVSPCFKPGTDPALIEAFEQAVFGIQIPDDLPDGVDLFQQTSRWAGTALNPGGSNAQGTPTILTYSFPADGVSVPNGVGEGTGPNALNGFLDGIYGNRATWRTIYDDMFARWGELCGITYVLEPNDDNQTLFNFSGVAGVRGDLRMAGKFIDGNSGTLAYNFFPQNGDMVIDTGDNFYSGTGNNSQGLRNVLWHEHGHGMGQLHVCPISQTKLMEPFISFAFTGPQIDDILNAQRHYGDQFEPNDNTSDATPLGSFAPGGSTVASPDIVSIDDPSDRDYFAVTLTAQAEITAVVSPVGFNYLQGTQTQACNTGSNYNPLLSQNLSVDLLNSSGSVLTSVNATGSGQDETLVFSVAAGDYFIRVNGSTAANSDEIQPYELDLSFATATGVPPSFVDASLPSEAAPGEVVSLSVGLDDGTDTVIDGPYLNYRRQGDGSFTQQALTPLGGNVFIADFPAFDCGDDPEYFLSVVGDDAGEVTFPQSGTLLLPITDGTVVSFADDSETDPGWTVSGNITLDTAGRWERGFPEGNGRGDPAADADGSGRAWLTGINASTDNTDVDDGETILTSPVFETNAGSMIEYSYWFNDIDGGPINGDDYQVAVSSDGGSTFSTVRTYNTPAGNWRSDTLVAGVDFTPGAQTRLRIITNDNDPQNVVEGGFDALSVSSTTCTPVGNDCLADVNMNGELEPTDFGAWLAAFNAGDPAADQNEDGMVTPTDFGAWLANFNAGCD